MIHCRYLVSEATWGLGNKVVGFDEPNQTFVDHTFHGFVKAASWAVVFWIRSVFPGLHMGMIVDIFHDSNI